MRQIHVALLERAAENAYQNRDMLLANALYNEVVRVSAKTFEDKSYIHPDTKNRVKFKSLPSEVQTEIRERYKSLSHEDQKEWDEKKQKYWEKAPEDWTMSDKIKSKFDDVTDAIDHFIDQKAFWLLAPALQSTIKAIGDKRERHEAFKDAVKDAVKRAW